jgi:hypothetical protein
VKQFRTTTGPFRDRPYYELTEIDRMCSEELQAVDLYPKEPGPVRIERFIEKRFQVTPEYQDLEGRILGFTRFGPTGVQAVVISKALVDSGARGAERVVNSTLAHEAGHILLHGHLFLLDGTSTLFENTGEPSKIMCRDGDVTGADRGRAYDSRRWYEFQANQAIGGLLLPRTLAFRSIADLVEQRGGLGVGVVPEAKREEATRRLAETFDVNPVVARIRLDGLYPAAQARQLTL